jgi:transmembrane sensor
VSSPDKKIRPWSALEEQAAEWLARRDRGFTPPEQDQFLHWLQTSPHHREAYARQQYVLQKMMGLADWQPVQSSEPNPDLFAPPSRLRWRFWAPFFAIAALLMLGLFLRSRETESRAPEKSFLRVNEKRVLPDGSIVDLKDGSQLEVLYTTAERRVRLSGEAHFVVAKNHDRPFRVEASNVVVRAVGTAFNVRIDSSSVEVLVTEGRVCVEQSVSSSNDAAPAVSLPTIGAGQCLVVPLAPDAPPPKVADVTPERIKGVLAWQTPRLQFYETPLKEAVAEFNRHNRQQLVLEGSDLASVPIGGSFRVDNVEGFVRLLEITVGIQGKPRGENEIVLTRAR